VPEAIGRKIIQCQPHMQQKRNTKLRNLLKRKIAKTRKLSELSKTEQNRLAKLNGMLDELRRGKNVQNRQLATWLTEEEYRRFELAAESGFDIAQDFLGHIYHQGLGVPTDYETAVKWFELIAEGGFAKAHCNLGQSYAEAKGVPYNSI
jgi:TPR repeat protein